jgi:hypothetical protein
MHLNKSLSSVNNLKALKKPNTRICSCNWLNKVVCHLSSTQQDETHTFDSKSNFNKSFLFACHYKANQITLQTLEEFSIYTHLYLPKSSNTKKNNKEEKQRVT